MSIFPVFMVCKNESLELNFIQTLRKFFKCNIFVLLRTEIFAEKKSTWKEKILNELLQRFIKITITVPIELSTLKIYKNYNNCPNRIEYFKNL